MIPDLIPGAKRSIDPMVALCRIVNRWHGDSSAPGYWCKLTTLKQYARKFRPFVLSDTPSALVESTVNQMVANGDAWLELRDRHGIPTQFVCFHMLSKIMLDSRTDSP